MKLRRKRGQAAAWEGWSARESGLKDFLPLSPRIPSSQHNTIEWSSSDEESKDQPTNNITFPREKVINLSENKTVPTFLSKSERRNNKIAKADDGRDCSFTAKISESTGKLKHDPLRLEGLRTPDVDVFISTENSLASSSMYKSISDHNQYNSEVNTDADVKVDPFKTPKQANDDKKRYCEDDLTLSPIIGSQRCKSTVEGQVSKSTLRSSDEDIDIEEPTSPVFGSLRIVKKQRTVYNFTPFERNHNDDFAPRKSINVPGISKFCGDMTQNAAKTPAKEVTDPDEDRVRSKIKRRNLNYKFSELGRQDFHRVEVKKADHTESLESAEQLPILQTEPAKEFYEKRFTEKMNTDTDHTSTESQFCFKTGAQWNSQKNLQHNNLPASNSRLSTLKASLLQNMEKEFGDDVDIEHTSSQNDTPRSKEPDSQSDGGIDCISSPCKEALDNSGTFSLVSHDPSISTGSAVSPGTINEEPNEKIKTGSDWIKALQQYTPEKPSSKEETEDAMDSVKKKAKKNGLAERLHRLILSWQSSVHMWTHQMSLKSPRCQKPHSLQKKVSTVDSKSTVLSSHHLGVSAKKLMDNSHKGFSSVVRNLQNIIVESPVSSPEASGLSKGNSLHMPKKCMDLRILKVGGRLPNNAALCEVIHSNPEELQRGMKMENEKEYKSEKGNDNYKRRYCVFFALSEQTYDITLHVNDMAKVYSPWQRLDLASHSTPVIFTSYFTIQENQFVMTEKQVKEEVMNSNSDLRNGNRNLSQTVSTDMTKKKKKIILTTWTCSCSGDASVLPSVCEAQQHAVHHPLVSKVNKDITFSNNPGFTVVKDTPEESSPQNDVHPAYTILQAIEKCGGVSDVPVTISIRAHRIISHRGAAGEVKEWEVVGQDAGGAFCTVKIPNRPLVCNLTDLLEGEGGTHTLTKVTISQRLTNTQDPGLFSLISSLHKAYQDAVCENPLLYSFLQDQASRPPQTYCYVFNVTLGLTDLLHNGQEVVTPVNLPQWSLHEALQVSCDGQRGSLSLHILYKFSSFLYVVSYSMESEDSDSSLATQEAMKQTEKGKTHRKEDSKNYFKMNNFLVAKIMIGSKTMLPSWIPENGTVMQSALLKDAVIWHGSVMVDKYSSIQQQDHKMRVTLFTLHKILQPLSVDTQHHDLTLISGNIIRVDEETAFTWPICGYCKSDNVQEMQNGTANCLACGQNSIPNTGYCLEVWLKCRSELQQADVKVKLYQRTIEKLLSVCSGAKEEGYIAESLIGQKIGPAVCVLEEARRLRRTQGQTYILTELPY
ncbi:uncharacterized protein [Panulirus ornatus]|uniref:uncharacterized protein n=1 Tax=Panulirus ornatus TaxID=150431 RepID=UPI003A8B85DB